MGDSDRPGGDRRCDNSHRWVPPDPDMDDRKWRAMVQSHVDGHRAVMGGAAPPPPSEPTRRCGTTGKARGR